MLQWLADQVINLAKGIADLALSISERVSALFQHIVNWANWAKDTAISFAENAFNRALSEVRRYADYLWYWLFKIRDEIVAWVNEQIKNAAVNVSSLGNWILSNINSIIAPIRDWLNSKIDALRVFVESITPNILGVIQWWKDRILALEYLFSTIRIPSLDDIKNLVLRDIQPIFNKLAEFAVDPIGYIIGVIAENIIPLLTSALAWGLGTIKYELPPAPTNYRKPKA